MADDLHSRIQRFMEAHTTLSLATLSPDGRPHAASLFFAEDENLSMIFVSEPSVLHSRNIESHPLVSATIAADQQDWRSIRGVQLAGECGLLQEADVQAAWAVYTAKFPFIVRDEPLNRRLRASGFYRIRPTWIRLIDNARGFGFKEELVLTQGKLPRD